MTALLRSVFSPFQQHWLLWAEALLVLLLFWLAGFAARRILFYYLGRLSAKTSNPVDDIIVIKSRIHVLLWAILLGLYAAGRIAPLGSSNLFILDRTVFILFILSVTLLLANVASSIIKVYSEKISLSLPLTSLTENLIKLIIIAIGVLILLAHLGVSITPLLTALGVGSLAVALALQDTLSNLFAGFYILANKQIRTGDYIRVDSGQEGFVMDIGWRATRLRELSSNVILIPNAKLGTSIVTNYFFPDREMSVIVEVCVSYASDLEKVEQITTAVAAETLRDVKGGVINEGFVPFIRYHTFGDSAIQFSVILRVKEFVDQYLVKHEFIKRLHERYRQENIDMPFPQRVVHLVK